MRLFLAVVLVGVLPGNRERVLHEQLLTAIPKLAGQFGDYPWILSPDADYLLQKAFAEAQSRRSDVASEGEGIVFRGVAISEGYHLVAVRGSDEHGGSFVACYGVESFSTCCCDSGGYCQRSSYSGAFAYLFSQGDFSRRWVNLFIICRLLRCKNL